MIDIKIKPISTKDTIRVLQKTIGGNITEKCGENILTINNEIGKGTIRFITYDWGVSLLEYNITYFQDIKIVSNTSNYNPIHFSYCLEGNFEHRFNDTDRNNAQIVEQFQSVITSSSHIEFRHNFFPKNKKLSICIIQIAREDFLKKRLNNVDQLNRKLYDVFMDTDHINKYAFFGAFNLKIGDKVLEIKNVKTKGMVRMMEIEGLIYQTLSMHILEHDQSILHKKLPTKLIRSELKIIKNTAQKIVKNISEDYSMEILSLETGLSESKLQEGFKLLYAKTVIKYIRTIRLELARDYIGNSEMNISEIMLTVGYSSRSYFSKIFTLKYGINPSEYLKKVRVSKIL